MTSFEWFLLVVIVIVVPLIIAVVVTLWTIDQANKRKRANRKDAQIGVKRKAALSPEEIASRKAARAEKDAEADTVTINNLDASESSTERVTSATGSTVTINNIPSAEAPKPVVDQADLSGGESEPRHSAR